MRVMGLPFTPTPQPATTTATRKSHNWDSSNRVVPTDWKRRKAAVLQRDAGICHVCGKPGADEVDHLLNVARGGTHLLDNLAAIHARPCHTNKTQQEAAEARRANRAKAKRQPEIHPGLR